MSAKAVEAALFSAGRPLTPQEVAEATGLPLKAADDALQELITACQDRGGALEVVRLGKKYALQLRREAITYGRRLAPQEIPGHLLRTLALVAHEQPMLQSELKRRMGDRVYEHVGELLELGMLERERAGRSFALSVTEAFDEYFGISATTQAELRAFLEQALSAS